MRVLRRLYLICGVLLVMRPARPMLAQPSAAANAGFDRYSAEVEARQHEGPGGALAGDVEARLRRGEVSIERLGQGGSMDGALLHHWRGRTFAPGATASEFERMLRNFDGYPRRFAPEVLEARVVAEDRDRMQVSMRVRQKHVLTVVMDTSYDVRFGRVARGGWSISRSIRIAEIAGAGTAGERALNAGEEHGFLWRMNTYWSWEERDGGLYVRVETVSLSRAIPKGLGWAVGPYVESIPRESLEFTLRAACRGLGG